MILAIDTGLKNFALVVMEANGTIHHSEVVQSEKTKKKKGIALDYALRIMNIFNRIYDLTQTYEIDTIAGELPSFGAQSSGAAVSLSAGATIMLGVSALYRIPIVLASPREVKESLTGNPDADKKQIMQRVCEVYAWGITHKKVKLKNKPVRLDPVYHVMGKKLSAGYFEHIADAISAFYACKKKGTIK